MRIFAAFPGIFLATAVSVLAAGMPYLTEPTLCPTRPEIAFVSGGDIWVVSAKGGEAHLLISNPAEESRPLYSPDGTRLAFDSTRTGGGDIYILTLASGDLKRLTFDERLDQLDSWSRDGKWIYFSNASHDVGGKNDIYRISSEGGTPMPVSADRFTNEYQGAPSPDGTSFAFAARGNGDQQWWRNGHSHLDESEIWVRKFGVKEGQPGAYEKLVDLNGRNNWPMWMPDGKQIYFMSDRGGAENIWSEPVGAKPKQVTKFTTGRVLWPSMGYDGKSVVFERDFKIWQLDTKTGEAYALPITLMGSAAGVGITRTAVGQFTGLDVSPDNKKIVLVGHGDIFAAAARDGGEAVQVTHTPGPESQVAWAPDSTRIVFVSQRDAISHVYLYDFIKRAETQLTSGPKSDQGPRFSPDGKTIAYVRDKHELRLIDPETKQDTLLVSGFLGGGFDRGLFEFSGDGKWIAYAATGEGSLRNVFVVPAAGGAPHQISFLANSNVNSIHFSPDGKYLLYETGQRTETPQIARIELTPAAPKFAEERFDDLFKPEAPRGRSGAGVEAKPAAKPVEIDFNGIRERISMLPLGLDVSNPQISPDGKLLLFTATVAGQQSLYLYPMETDGAGGGGRGGRGGGAGGRTARQLTTTPGPKQRAQFSSDSKEVYFLEGGRVNAIGVDNHQVRTVNVNASMDIDFAKEKMAVFEEAWAGQRDNYYDPKFHGADWDKVRKTYAPLIEAAANPDEMRRILRLMIGELNSSHSGISAPAGGAGGAGGGRGEGVGQLGLSFDATEYWNSGKMKVTEVLPHSPAELAKIKPGEELLKVNGTAVGAHVNLDELLDHTAGKRVVLDIGGHDVTVLPVASLAEQMYRKWVEDNRAYVLKVSNGRLGYIHMRDMSEQALTQLYLDLDADNHARDGVVIDIRNNNGGFVNAYALDVLSRRPYLTMTGRDAPPGPARTELGQRALELPTVLVTNQHSLSDAEDFTEGYRTLKLGKVVGEPTSGWIIYTGSMNLVDGTVMRMPGTRITGVDGKDMELHPRPVDVEVSRPIGETYTGKDSQLDAAVKELLSELPKK